MSKEYLYSKEWRLLLESSIIYQERVRDFFQIDEKLKLEDLRNILKSRDFAYDGLKVIENMSNDIIHKLLYSLIYVIIYSNVSDSCQARKIVLNSDIHLFREYIYNILIDFSIKEKDIEILDRIAFFLYDLKYKTELLQYIDDNMLALIESEFIENEEDLKEIYEMKDLSES